MAAKKKAAPVSQSIDNYYGLVLLVEAANTNPQGDPDQENRPRQLPDGRGLITSSGIKRKIRDFLSINGEKVYVARHACLETTNYELAKDKGLKKPEGLKKGYTQDDAGEFVRTLAGEYYDVRAFGQLVAKLTTAVRGPVQMSDGVSIDPVEVNDAAICRVAVATEKEAESQGDANRTMGSHEERLHRGGPREAGRCSAAHVPERHGFRSNPAGSSPASVLDASAGERWQDGGLCTHPARTGEGTGKPEEWCCPQELR
jgi:CRISPR-associated protein Csd2